MTCFVKQLKQSNQFKATVGTSELIIECNCCIELVTIRVNK